MDVCTKYVVNKLQQLHTEKVVWPCKGWSRLAGRECIFWIYVGNVTPCTWRKKRACRQHASRLMLDRHSRFGILHCTIPGKTGRTVCRETTHASAHVGIIFVFKTYHYTYHKVEHNVEIFAWVGRARGKMYENAKGKNVQQDRQQNL